MTTIILSESATCASWSRLSQRIMRIGKRSSINTAIVRRPGCVPRTEHGRGHRCRSWSSLRRYGRESPGPFGNALTTVKIITLAEITRKVAFLHFRQPQVRLDFAAQPEEADFRPESGAAADTALAPGPLANRFRRKTNFGPFGRKIDSHIGPFRKE